MLGEQLPELKGIETPCQPTRTGRRRIPGYVVTGRTLDETRARMARAMEMHLAAMREDGDQVPEQSHFELLEAV